MRHQLAPLALLAIGFAAGCEFDLTEVQTVDQFETRFTIRLHVPLAQRPLEVTAFLEPGRDSRGQARTLPDDSLRLDGFPVAPGEVTPNGMRFYRISDVDAQAKAVRVRPPRVSGVDASGGEIEIVPLRVDAPDTLVVTRAAGLAIRLSGLAAVDEGGDGSWSLRISTGQCDRVGLLSIAGMSAPRALLQVPLDLLPDGFEGGSVHYDGVVRTLSSSADRSYHVSVTRSFEACIPLVVLN